MSVESGPALRRGRRRDAHLRVPCRRIPLSGGTAVGRGARSVSCSATYRPTRSTSGARPPACDAPQRRAPSRTAWPSTSTGGFFAASTRPAASRASTRRRDLGPRARARGPRAQQPQRRRRAQRRRHLLHRSHVWAHGVLRRPARTAARLSRRVPRRAAGQHAHAPRRRLRAAERAVFLARRARAVRQRHRARARSGVRRARRRHAFRWPGLDRDQRAKARAHRMA